LVEDGENFLEELKVGVHVSGGKENIIQVNKNVGKVGEKAVHEALESLSGVAETKGHVKIFEKAKRSDYCCFGNVRRSNRDLMVAFDQVQCGENCAFVELICEIVKVGKGVGVGSCGGVEAAVIATGTPTAIFLRDHVKRGGPGTIGAANNTLFFKLKELLLGNSVFFRVEAAGMGGDGACIGFNGVENTVSRLVRM
jgi:hypothetical protein